MIRSCRFFQINGVTRAKEVCEILGSNFLRKIQKLTESGLSMFLGRIKGPTKVVLGRCYIWCMNFESLIIICRVDDVTISILAESCAVA